ncbi:MAG: hypothetical protein MZV65_00450 [Chromatiales bacterium]|nr:hypothetical protein [Chromatiales bacterium]
MVNGAECEPYLTCDDRLMREQRGRRGRRRAPHARTRMRRRARSSSASRTTSREALAAMRGGGRRLRRTWRWWRCRSRYPMGSDKQLIQILHRPGDARREGRAADTRGAGAQRRHRPRRASGACATAHPLISRIVTVNGGAVAQAAAICEAPIGALRQRSARVLRRLARDARAADHGRADDGPARCLGLEVPVVKGTSGILALTAAEVERPPPGALHPLRRAASRPAPMRPDAAGDVRPHPRTTTWRARSSSGSDGLHRLRLPAPTSARRTSRWCITSTTPRAR